mmetsp:Transcript_63365/g.182378  ORF Transcript_63365/g.182378 Transcript_63365/m.182378 type:complete len:275 (-) Transcript_63365:203-1027(-)
MPLDRCLRAAPAHVRAAGSRRGVGEVQGLPPAAGPMLRRGHLVSAARAAGLRADVHAERLPGVAERRPSVVAGVSGWLGSQNVAAIQGARVAGCAGFGGQLDALPHPVGVGGTAGARRAPAQQPKRRPWFRAGGAGEAATRWLPQFRPRAALQGDAVRGGARSRQHRGMAAGPSPRPHRLGEARRRGHALARSGLLLGCDRSASHGSSGPSLRHAPLPGPSRLERTLGRVAPREDGGRQRTPREGEGERSRVAGFKDGGRLPRSDGERLCDRCV